MNRALENLMGIMGMGTWEWEQRIFFREWEKGNGNKTFFLGNGNREWEPEKVVPAGHYYQYKELN
jgi:hypothetical protein